MRAAPDPPSAHEIWTRERDRLAREHPASPVPWQDREGFAGLCHADYDPSLRFEVVVDHDVPPQPWHVATGTDGVVPFDRIGQLHLPVGDLDVWWLGSYGGGVFVPIKDASSGESTYGGGRYLIDTVKGADLGGTPDGGLVVDLNFAYNPSCAYDPAWACPLAPPGNSIDTLLYAGELMPR